MFLWRYTMISWRTMNVLCLELIPAELLSFYRHSEWRQSRQKSIFFFKDTMFASRTKNGCKVSLIPVELIPTPSLCGSVVEPPEFPCELACEDPTGDFKFLWAVCTIMSWTVSLPISLHCWEDIPSAEIDHASLKNTKPLMSWINTFWTWDCDGNCLWCQSR